MNWRLLLCLGAAIAGSCTSFPTSTAQHVVMVNGRGNPVDPTGNVWCEPGPGPCNGRHTSLQTYDEITPEAFQRHLDGLFAALKEYTDPQAQAGGKRKVLIFIHGGLNTQVSTLERAAGLQGQILEDQTYFPIFVNWQSSLISSYFDHLVFIRQGQDLGGWGVPWAPFYLVSDVVRSVARTPIVWSFLIWNDIKSWSFVTPPEETQAGHVTKELKAEHEPGTAGAGPGDAGPRPHAPGMDIADGKDLRRWPEMTFSGASWLITVPFKVLSAPFIDGIGKSAWDTMLRRTSLPFRSEAEFRSDSQMSEDARKERRLSHMEASGGLSIFLRRLEEEIAADGGDDAWEIALVGHSMGAIVINNILRDFEDLPVKDIVYMAAACTIRDYEQAAFPFLLRDDHAETQIYHLMLHDKAENRDRWEPLPYIDLPPRGSLLVWIDDFLSNPGTPMDRSLGRFCNLMPAIHDTPEALRDHIHVKEFSTGDAVRATDPQKHGDFSSKLRFWRPACWQPEWADPAACYSEEALW